MSMVSTLNPSMVILLSWFPMPYTRFFQSKKKGWQSRSPEHPNLPKRKW